MLCILYILYLSAFVEIPHRHFFVLCLKARINHFTPNINFSYNNTNNIFHFKSNFKVGYHTHLVHLPYLTFINNRSPNPLGIPSFQTCTSDNSHKDSKLSSTSNTSGSTPDKKHTDFYGPKSYSNSFFGDEELDPIPSKNDSSELEQEEVAESLQTHGISGLLTEKPWVPGDDLQLPYMMDDKLELSFDKWPENCFLRVKLFSYYKHLVKLAAERIKLGLKDNENLKVTNPMALPMRRKRWCYLSSAFIDKRSKDLIEIQEHVRVVDILPVRNSNAKRFKGILMIPLPHYVSFDYWFEEVHKPVKNKMIHDLFRKRTWVSKYFLYHRDKHKKRELIEKITSPELVDEVPLRLKKEHKADYYFYQLGELLKLHRFIVARKAEDEARRFYNVKTPEIWEVDDVRFIGNYEDRQFDPDYSKVDRLTKHD